MTAKMKSKPYRAESRRDWDRVRVKVMRWCLRVKLAQNWDTFGTLLLDTGDRDIVEHSRRDDFWGAKPVDKRTLVGMNALGRLLMELRESVKTEPRESFLRVAPLHIDNFRLWGRPIERVAAKTLGQVEGADGRPTGSRRSQLPGSIGIHQLPEGATPTAAARPLYRGATTRPVDECGGRLKRYPILKDSGIEWLGRVPEHWQIIRLKHWVNVNELVLSEDTDPDYTFSYLDIGLVGTGRLTDKPERVRFEDSPSRARRIVRRGDTIVSTVRTYLKAVWHAEHLADDLIASTGFAVLTPRGGTFPKFVTYFCQSEAFINRVTTEAVGVAYPAIAETRLVTFEASVPPFSEQVAIVRFLDRIERRIRRYIRTKQKLVALLEEQKRAIIYEAVTGQTDLRTGQPHKGYKRTGVDWLRAVPEHWKVRRLGQIARVFNGATPSRAKSVYWESGTVPWMNSSKVNEEIVVDPSELITEQALRECSIAVAPAGAAILGLVGQGRTRGMSALLGIEAGISQNLAAIVPGSVIDGRFLHRLLTAFYEDVRGMGRGGNQEALNCDLVSRLRLPVPPWLEQMEILGRVDSALQKLARSIEKVTEEVGLVREYRTCLIADVVTGKLDVREVAAALPEVDPLAADDRLDSRHAMNDFPDFRGEVAAAGNDEAESLARDERDGPDGQEAQT